MVLSPGRLIVSLAFVGSFTTLGATPAGVTREVKSILVTVLDDAGDPIRNLEAREFIVVEDGTQREVIEARPNNEPLYVALLVDTAKPILGVQYPTQELRRGLGAFSRRVLGGTAGSQVAIIDVALAGSVVVPFTTEISKLRAWSDRLVANQQGSGVLLESLVVASRQLASKETPRRAIVSVTFDSPESSAVTPQIVAETVLKSGAAYWPITIRGSGISTKPVLLRETLFSYLPEQTGGLQVSAVSTTGLETILGRVAAALTSQYEVTYARPNGVNAKVIEAKSRRGAKVLRASWIR
jgi:CTP:molybdopterin cytidylyltransferase MocA